MPPALNRSTLVPVSDVRALVQRALGDAYTVERELGGGGMAHVFVAFDHQLERRVVVKVLPPDLTATLSVERFRREILMAAALQHPHIVPVLSSGVAEGLPYFLMPFVEGESLREAVRRGPMPVRDVVSILRDVARKLQVAFHFARHCATCVVEGRQQMGDVDSGYSRVGLEARGLFRQAHGKVTYGLSAVGVGL